MKKTLSKPVTRIFLLIIGFFAALSIVRALNFSFDYYVGEVIDNGMRMELIIAFPLFAACVSLLSVSIWQGKEEGRIALPWRKIDFSLLVILIYSAALLMTYIACSGKFWRMIATDYRITYNNRIYLLVLAFAVYILVMALLIEAVARLRDHHLVSTLYWLRFFKHYPIQRPIGLLMILLLSGNLVYLFVLCPYSVIRDRLNISLLVSTVFTLIVLTYFCSFVLSLAQEFDKANTDKIQAERFKAELITNVSHDIRTPLTAIINYVDLLKDLPIENSQFIEYTDILNKKTVRLKTLISDLMEASKAGTGNLSVDLKEIDLGEIIGQIAGEYDDPFSERSLTLVFRQPEQQVLIRADSGHLWRVLENLFSNAAKYALQGTRIFAEILLREGKPMFSLKNVSQDPIDLPGDALTEQFIRGDRARNSEGSGLGLYIAKSLVELMGGHFSICVSADLFEVLITFENE